MSAVGQLLLLRFLSAVLIQPFTVRVHAGIARKPWARLWYLCRGLDPQGRGIVDLPAEGVCQLLAVSKPTLYEWLRDGKCAGAFRSYKFRQNRLRIILGGLHKVCESLGLQTWGAIAVIPLLEVNFHLRAVATGIVTADLQSKSHFAARRSLKDRERQFYSPPTAEAILAQGRRSSQKPVKGQVPFLVWVGQRLAFVSKSFVPYGASQRSIGASLGISEWTVRRHHRQLGLERRQLVQAKAAYQLIDAGMQWEAQTCYAEPGIWSQIQGDRIQLFEPNGITSSRREGGHPLARQRLFRCAGKTWLYRCNIYDVSHIHLTSMKAARRQYRLYLDRFATSTAGGEGHGDLKGSNPPPGKDEQNP